MEEVAPNKYSDMRDPGTEDILAKTSSPGALHSRWVVPALRLLHNEFYISVDCGTPLFTQKRPQFVFKYGLFKDDVSSSGYTGPKGVIISD
jgi:hypothetical protein